MRQYDVAIAGEGLGVLVTSALLSAAGKKIILLSPILSPEANRTESASGIFLFPSGPSLTYGFERGGAFQQLFLDLGIPLEKPTVQSYQVALPQRRITVFPDQARTFDELKREFPREYPSLVSLYRDLENEARRISKSRIAAYLSKRSSAGRILRKRGFSRELLSFFNVQSLFFFQRPVAQLSLAMLILLCNSRPSSYYGGFEKLTALLRTIILRNGGEIQNDDPTTEMIYRKGGPTFFKTKQSEITARTIILGKPDTMMWLNHLGIKDEVIPVGMERDVLYQPDYARPDDFYVISLSSGNDGASPAGMRALNVALRTNSPLPPQKELAAQIGHIMPFLNEFTVRNDVVSASHDPSLPSALAFKPVATGTFEPLLFKASGRHIFLLHQRDYAPLQVIQAVRLLINKIVK